MGVYVRYFPTPVLESGTAGATLVSGSFLQGVEDALINTPNKTPTADSDNLIAAVGDTVVLAVGNAASTDPGPHTGTPSGNFFPIKFMDTCGTAGVTVKQTTQLFVMWRTYKERVVDDSSETGSSGVILTSAYGGFASAQTLPAVGWEGIGLVQGTVTLNNKLIGVVGSTHVQDTGHADTLINFYSSGSSVATGASCADVIAFYADTPSVLGTQTGHSWSFHGAEDVRFLKSVVVGSSSVTAARMFVQNRASSADPAIAIANGSGATGNLFEARDSTNNKLWALDVAGIPRWYATANQQTTVGAAGGASALPATPTKYLKVKDSAGTTYVVPAYAAS